jgi:carbon-monoxide dehydrogenase medium subunit
LQPFEYIVPKDLAEASTLLVAGNGTIRPFQGGTDLLVRIRGGFVQPQTVIDLKGLPGMQEIHRSENGWLIIGAACTMNQVAANPLVRQHYDLLVQGCESVASYQLRNRATIGGNCCNASPAADTAPALYCLDAVAKLYGPAGTRRVPIADFFVGPGKTALGKGEFLTSLHLPPAPAGAKGVFNKLGRTRLGDISMVSVAVYACPGDRRQGTGDSLAWRIALGAVGPTPLRATAAEAALAADTSPEGIRRAALLATEASRPIDDIRASAAYRKAMVAVLTRRGIEAILQQVAVPPLPLLLTGIFGNPGGTLTPPTVGGTGGPGGAA